MVEPLQKTPILSKIFLYLTRFGVKLSAVRNMTFGLLVRTDQKRTVDAIKQQLARKQSLQKQFSLSL